MSATTPEQKYPLNFDEVAESLREIKRARGDGPIEIVAYTEQEAAAIRRFLTVMVGPGKWTEERGGLQV